MKDVLKTIFDEEVKTPQVGYFWKGLALFLLGVIVGFLFAPIKKGIKIGCNNGCDNGNNCTDSGNFTPCDSITAEGCCDEQ
ncbi:hypothetical protein [Ruminococcus sp.]|uniref:hypothetical protein n=1 Tax=Ruminococcus sp. TaxID=41978 RepID=UPI0025D6E495|nr:hypothetical protein [Ruminococcus sp.]MBQ8965781.1 hypothetical protein [Ruminococcus sp.]